ncbi:MAG: tRNA (N6-isopentenyl adenosine(37)-C2)-methylthiotransferase MiaB [Candidatus Ancillula sp.]|jgi:tRNA-2-methylthio-N6-dimethylallyladenosine synthase|nr:tRNA (N6-isopentenyl adenosine(37)-C2)-methylthiotransferase MiaB [Candidatus Ancillula sp.]
MKTYYVQTLGCQMNEHDSERIAGMLESMGYKPTTLDAALKGKVDVFAINTCAVRENAANKLYGHLGQLATQKRLNPKMQIAVGGCLAQKDKEQMVMRAPWVDVVFGTHNLHGLPELLKEAAKTSKAQVEILPQLVQFPSTLQAVRKTNYSAWVSISMGCNNSCTFCIVPLLRGRERDRRPDEILAEVKHAVKNGASEVILLGQNVNSYGTEFGDRNAFAKLLRACGELESSGLKRVRFTSPHPAAFTDVVLSAMSETNNVMPNLHMPLQSGSDRILRLMRRSYRASSFLKTLEKVRNLIPEVAITTDIIVGFPDETDEDFEKTLEVVKEAQFSSAYTFQYSIRPGTVAANMPNQIPKDVVQHRFEKLLKIQEEITLSGQKAQLGKTVSVMISAHQHRKDDLNGRLSGISEDGRLVHINTSGLNAKPGEIVQVNIISATPYYLVADVV